MIRLICLVVFLLGSTFASVVAVGQEAAADDRESISRSIEQLSRDSYSKRQQATLEIWRRREQTRDQVQQAARHPDPEVAGRAKWILRQWRMGALPDTPPEVARLLQRSDGPEAIESLLEGGQFTAAIVAIEESAGTLDREAVQQRIVSALQRRFPIYVHFAIQSNSLPQLVELIDMVADSPELAACRLQLLQQMGVEIDDSSLLPKSASTWTETETERATVLTLVMLGRMDEAIAFAKEKESVDPSLLQQCQIMGARWPEAAALHAELAKQAEAGGTDFYSRWAVTLIAAERAGDDELVRQAVDALVAPPAEGVASLANERRWKTLALHGFIDEALQIVTPLVPEDAALVALSAARPEQAIEALGFSLEQLDQDLSQWIGDALASQQEGRLTRLSPQLEKILALMQILISIGRHDAAHEIAEELSKSPATIGSIRVREYLLSTLTSTRRKDWIAEFTVLENEKSISPTSLHTISRTLANCDAMTMEVVIGGLSRDNPAQSMRDRFQTAYDLFSGRIPAGFDPYQDFQSLADYATQDRATPLRGRFPNRPNVMANSNLVHLFARHGQSELARETLLKLVNAGDSQALFLLAEQELDSGRAEIADQYFEAIFNQVVRQGRAGARFPTAEDSALAVKALIGQSVVARRLGDQQRAAELEREIRLGLSTPSIPTRSDVVESLGKNGLTMMAIEAYEAMLPLTVLGTADDASLYDVARGYSTLAYETNPDEAAHWFDLAITGALETVNFRPSAYISLPLFVHRWSIEGALARGDKIAAEKHLNRILRLDPLDIDFAERLLPEMREAGVQQVADEALNQIVDRGLRYAAAFPFDAMTANNVAWVAAMNEKRLDDALTLSRIAITAEPDSATYRDTLAEVLFLLGRKQEALQIEQSCLLDDPDQWHLHEQIEKYQQALQEAE